MSRCGQDQVLVALLVEREAMKRFRGRDAGAFLDELRGCAPLRERLAGVDEPVDLMATGPLGRGASRVHGSGVMLVGDSAGALDPITAQGIAHALRAAQIAAEVASEALQQGQPDAAALAPYARRWQAERQDAA